ncbi:MAG: hypothetical protein DRO36_04365 [Candidatus Hecatellales archaeon]|nr:MAG: hypothetical protein DRO36_04365 [Candidatus Hecatellales archaeon]
MGKESVNKKIVYVFSEPGKENTEKVIEAVKERVSEENIGWIVVASATGETGVKVAEAFRDTNVRIVVVAESASMTPPKEEYVKKLKEFGVPLLRGVHAFSGVNESYNRLYGGVSVSSVVAHTLRRFSQGVKVAVEVVLMAADAGLIPLDQEVISIAGTGRGADTALIIRPSTTSKFFDKEQGLEIREIIAMPRKKRFY